MYCAQYTCLAAKHTGNTEMMHCSLVGRCCESYIAVRLESLEDICLNDL